LTNKNTVKVEFKQRLNANHRTVGYQMSSHSPRLQRLFEELLERDITSIKPVFDLTSKMGHRYPQIDDLLEASSEETVQTLDSLANEGVLERSFHDKLLTCVKCGSFNIRISTHCAKCDSANISKTMMLQHEMCGYIGPEEMFRTVRGLVCPKCREEVVFVNPEQTTPKISSNYDRRISIALNSLNLYSTLYRCNECNELFDKTVERWHCLSCQGRFPKDQVGETVIHSYKLNQDASHRLRMELRPRRQLQEFLKRHGYLVQSPAKIQGRSGVEHEIDLYATKQQGDYLRKIVVGVTRSNEEIGLEEVLKLYIKAHDVESSHVILFAIPKLSEEAKQFAAYYRMKAFESDDLERALNDREVWSFLMEEEPSIGRKEERFTVTRNQV